MAAIRETLTLEDKFSAVFTQYINLGEKAAGASNRAIQASQNYQSVLNSLDRRLISLNAQFSVGADKQQAMAAAGQQGTAEFAALDAQLESLGATIRDLTAQYDAVSQQATQAAQAAQQFSNNTKQATQSSDKLAGSIKRLVGTYVGLQGIKNLFSTSDALTQSTARLDLMNDGLQTTEELNEMIFASAQRSRGAYQDTADMVSKLGMLAGSAFGSSQEIVAFAEQINKQIALSGTAANEAQAAIEQITGAMSKGTVQGDELNAILLRAPSIADALAGYMGVSTDSLQKMASEGQITAEVVKNAMFAAAEETNEKFESMPMTWSQVWTMMQNIAIKVFQPILNAINWVANNLDILIPIVLTLGAAFAVFMVAANWMNICKTVTGALASAQKMLSAVMATGWGIPLLIIIAVIGVLYLVVAIINKVTGASISATGLIAGAVAVMAAAIINTVIGLINGIIQFAWTYFVTPFLGIIEWVLNVVNGGFDSFGGAVANLIGQIISWFLDLGKVVTKIIDAIFGTNWTGGLESLQDKVLQWGKNDNAITLNRDAPTINYRMDYGDAWDAGYEFGSNLSDILPDLSMFDYSAQPYSPQLDDISESVAGIEKSVDMTQEDLESLIDVAERRYVNQINLTSQTPIINVSGQNTGRTQADRTALAEAMKRVLVEQISSSSVRSTARAF